MRDPNQHRAGGQLAAWRRSLHLFHREDSAIAAVWVSGGCGRPAGQGATVWQLIWQHVHGETPRAETKWVGRFLGLREVEPAVRPYPPEATDTDPLALAQKR